MKTPTSEHGVPYRRYSDPTQGSGSSEYRQVEGFEQFLLTSGLTGSPYAYFDKGESAYHGAHRNAEFGRLLADCEARKFPKNSVIWFEDMDRFGRGKLYVVLGDWQRIIGSGYKIHVASLGRTFDAKSSEMEMIPVIMKAILAHEESEKKSVRGKINRQLIRQTGKTIKGKPRCLKACPFWLSVGEDGLYHENDKAEMVRQALRYSLQGFGCKEIFRKLGSPTNKKGKPIDVLGVLRNRAIVGEFTPSLRTGKNTRQELHPVANHYPNIDKDNIFHQVQNALDSRRRMVGRKGSNGVPTNLFTNLFYGSDGQEMYVKALVSKKVMNRRTPAPQGEIATWNYAEIETVLLQHLRELALTGTVASPVEDYKAELAQVEKRIAMYKTRMAADDNLAEQMMDMVAAQAARAKELGRKIEAEKGRVPEVASLAQTQEIIAALANATGADLLEIRTRLKASIRRLVVRIDCEFLDLGKMKCCKMLATLSNGEKRAWQIVTNKRATHTWVKDNDCEYESLKIKVG